MSTLRITDTDPTGKQRRTDQILARWKGKHNEWQALHGMMCLTAGWDVHDACEVMDLFDSVQLAARLDEINREILAGNRTFTRAPA